MSFKGHNRGLCKKCGKLHKVSSYFAKTKGKKRPPEWGEKIKASLKKHYSEHDNVRKGKIYEDVVSKEKAEKWKNKAALAFKGKPRSPEVRKKLSLANIGFKASKETKLKLSKIRSAKPNKPWLGKKRSEEHKEIIRAKTKALWENQEYREKTLKAIFKSFRHKTSSYEQRLIDLFKKFNIKYKFCGSGNDIVIMGKKIPDFINTNGKKIVLEVYTKGHLGNLKPINYEKIRKTHFAKYGYKVIYFNEDDLFCDKWERHCLDKIK